MVKAGVPSPCSRGRTHQYADELTSVFQSGQLDDFLAYMCGNERNKWDSTLTGNDRLRFIINCFTRLRYCDANGQLDLKDKGAIGTQAPGLIPWFDVPNRKTANDPLLFGHWSTIGLHQSNNTACLDSGCLWGGQLSAIALDGTNQITSEDCKGHFAPF